jgi:hypothetical protein
MNLEKKIEFKEQRLYFAYGSNMAKSRMLERKLNVRIIGIGYLEHYKLMFNKMSKNDPTVGFANIVPFWGERVYGIVYDLANAKLLGDRYLSMESDSAKQIALNLIRDNLKLLDRAEGYPNHYQRTLVGINVLNFLNSNLKLIQCLTYIANSDYVSKDNLQIREDYIEKINEGLNEFSPYSTADSNIELYKQNTKQLMSIWKK